MKKWVLYSIALTIMLEVGMCFYSTSNLFGIDPDSAAKFMNAIESGEKGGGDASTPQLMTQPRIQSDPIQYFQTKKNEPDMYRSNQISTKRQRQAHSSIEELFIQKIQQIEENPNNFLLKVKKEKELAQEKRERALEKQLERESQSPSTSVKVGSLASNHNSGQPKESFVTKADLKEAVANSQKDEIAIKMDLEEKKKEKELKKQTEQDEKERKSLQRDVKQFGYDIFENTLDTTFTQANLAVGSDYVLGPGDQVVISVWGKMEERIELTLDREGKVNLPRFGQVVLAGKTVAGAERLVSQAFNQKYANIQTSLSIGKLRTIKVFVLGDVERPGIYQLPALSSAFYALYQAGGPTKVGSLRKIKLIRNKQTIQTMDLYRYLLYGNNSQDPSLKTGDTVFVPPIGGVTMIAGGVKRPGIYEIQEGSSLKDLIAMSGGMSGASFYQNIQIYRTEKGDTQHILDKKFDSQAEVNQVLGKLNAKDMDLLVIQPASSELKQFVTIQGNISRPGQYGLTQGLTIGELISRASGLKPNSYTNRIEIYRNSKEFIQEIIALDLSKKENGSFKLRDRDSVQIYTFEEALRLEKKVHIEGAVKLPGEYDLYENMRVSDLLFIAKLDPYASLETVEISRMTPGSQPLLLTKNLTNFMKNTSISGNVALKDGDRVFIKRDSKYATENKVELAGEVVFPGTYYFQPGEHLSDVIARAGGFTDKAFLSGSVFTRVSVKRDMDSAQIKILNEEKKRLVYDQAKLSKLSNDSEDADKLRQSGELTLSILESKIEESRGRIVIGLDELSKFKGSKDDVLLQRNDRLSIPPVPASVQIIGGVRYTTAVVHIPQKDVAYYIGQAGGLSEYASKKDIYIIKANGTISRSTKEVEVGDLIFVPEKVSVPTDWVKVISTVADVLYKSAVGIAAVRALR